MKGRKRPPPPVFSTLLLRLLSPLPAPLVSVLFCTPPLRPKGEGEEGNFTPSSFPLLHKSVRPSVSLHLPYVQCVRAGGEVSLSYSNRCAAAAAASALSIPRKVSGGGPFCASSPFVPSVCGGNWGA